MNNRKEVRVWGTGEARREFMYSDDMADATLFILGLDKTYLKLEQDQCFRILILVQE